MKFPSVLIKSASSTFSTWLLVSEKLGPVDAWFPEAGAGAGARAGAAGESRTGDAIATGPFWAGEIAGKGKGLNFSNCFCSNLSRNLTNYFELSNGLASPQYPFLVQDSYPK